MGLLLLAHWGLQLLDWGFWGEDEARGKMKKAQAKFGAAREKTAVTRVEAVSARKALLVRGPDAELPVFPEDREIASDA